MGKLRKRLANKLLNQKNEMFLYDNLDKSTNFINEAKLVIEELINSR